MIKRKIDSQQTKSVNLILLRLTLLHVVVL